MLSLSGCALAPPAQYLIDAPTSTLRLRPIIASLEVRDVSLPLHAGAEGLTVQGTDGVLRTNTSAVWADAPSRAATLSLVRHLSAITGARVAPEPWPFVEPPSATLTVSVETFFASVDGPLQLTGSYALASFTGGLSDRGGRFDITVPVPEDAPTTLIGAAHGTALRSLSETIARQIAR